MPWCPDCKTEYQTGVTVCSDCKTTLVDELKADLIPFFQAEDKMIADKLASFFNYSDLLANVIYDEENDCYIVAIDPEKQLEAKKLYQAFYFVERERIAKGEVDKFTSQDDKEQSIETDDTEAVSAPNNTLTDDESSPIVIEEDDFQEYGDTLDMSSESDSVYSDDNSDADDTSEEDSIYIMKADQYKDLAGTVWIFLLFGVAGIIFVLLNVLGIISIFTNWLPNLIMTAMFLFFIYVAISTNNKAKKIKDEIKAEENLTKQINEWLTGNVTEDFLLKISDEAISYELNYLKQVTTIKDLLIKEFGNQNQAYLDRLIEEYYNNTFDKAAE